MNRFGIHCFLCGALLAFGIADIALGRFGYGSGEVFLSLINAVCAFIFSPAQSASEQNHSPGPSETLSAESESLQK